MAGVDSAKIAIELQVLIFDRLQVVSYKWLSRNFSVPSNSAKRLLQEFVEHHGDGLEAIYAISGWSKTEPGCYSVRLVQKSKLEEVKAEFKDNYSVHIYSVQSCLPKDPAELWGAEFVQAEGLFNQPSSVNNCLWDNRFSAVSYPLVKRNLNGKSTRIGPPISQLQLASAPVVNGLPKQNVSLPQVHVPSTTEKSLETVPKAAPQSSVSATDVKEALAGKSVNATTAATNKKKGHNGKTSEGTLASLWGRASSKPKSSSSPAPANHVNADAQINALEAAGYASNVSSKPKPSSPPPSTNHDAQINASDDAGNASKVSSKPKPSSPPPPTNHVNADAQINAWEDAGNVSDEDEDCFGTRRVQSTNGSGRKRRFVFDMSDDENEDDVIGSKPAASLASPELPKQTSKAKDEPKNSQNKDAAQENKNVKAQGKEKAKTASACKSTVSGKSTKGIQSRKAHDQVEEGKVDHSADNNTKPGSGMEEKNICHETKTCQSEYIPSDDACASKAGAKKRKVLKTHIDGRGREVTEVTWEVDGVEEEKAKDVHDTVNSSVPKNVDNKPKETGKVPSVDPSHSANPTTKLSSKHTQKGVGKDTRQGNILSFFKKS